MSDRLGALHNTRCPYCERTFELDLEYCRNQDEDFKVSCHLCDSVFMVYTNYDISFPSRRLTDEEYEDETKRSD